MDQYIDNVHGDKVNFLASTFGHQQEVESIVKSVYDHIRSKYGKY